MKYLILVLISFQTIAQNFSALTIPAELKEKAHAVVRNHETEFYLKDIGEAVMKVKGTITILDEKGNDHANLVIYYNKFTKVSDIEAHIYDATGKQIKRLKRSDIESFSTSSGQNSIEDNYVKIASLANTTYPYTVDYSYQYTDKNMMFYPVWQAILDNAEFTAVEKSSFSVSLPSGLALRYKEQNMPAQAVITTEDGRNNYRWKVSNLKAIEKEPNSPHYAGIMPTVYTAPTGFKVDDYIGMVNSWNDIGQFYGALNADRDKLPAELTAKIKDLVKNEPDVAGKVKKVYDYLQANTRYVSIQLGIGGWQSMKAADVATKGYGDCKALTNFTKAMLKDLGIPSYMALVRAGENKAEIQADFPSFQFNHVILCVPAAKDTLWLECTSQNNPFGYLGSFTGDRYVVLVTENGGKLIRTPAYKHSDNQLVRTGTIELKDNGEATATITTEYTGLQHEIYAQVANFLSNDDQKKWLYKNLSLPSVEILNFSLSEKRDKLPVVEEKLNLHLRNTANKSGARLFITPNLLNQQRSLPMANNNRKTELELDDNYLDIDNISFRIPKGYTAEYLPEPIKIETKFGKYIANVEMKEEVITYKRELSMFKGRYSPSAYNEWVDFRKKIVKADKNQVVLVLKP
jgi:transglutaminase-like putative cysteine protease